MPALQGGETAEFCSKKMVPYLQSVPADQVIFPELGKNEDVFKAILQAGSEGEGKLGKLVGACGIEVDPVPGMDLPFPVRHKNHPASSPQAQPGPWIVFATQGKQGAVVLKTIVFKTLFQLSL